MGMTTPDVAPWLGAAYPVEIGWRLLYDSRRQAHLVGRAPYRTLAGGVVLATEALVAPPPPGHLASFPDLVFVGVGLVWPAGPRTVERLRREYRRRTGAKMEG
jgi:hypothetical protein